MLIFNAKLWNLHQNYCFVRIKIKRSKRAKKTSENTKEGRTIVATSEQLSRQNKRKMVEEMSRHSNFCRNIIEKNSWKSTKSCDNLKFSRDIYQKGNVKHNCHDN